MLLIITFAIVFIIYAFLLKYIYLSLKVKTRFKDNLAVLVFSQSAILFSLFFVFPVQLGVFGVHWFVFNPSPILIKPSIAYALISLDAILLIWGLFQIILAHYIQTKSVIISIFLGLILYLFINILFLFFPFSVS